MVAAAIRALAEQVELQEVPIIAAYPENMAELTAVWPMTNLGMRASALRANVTVQQRYDYFDVAPGGHYLSALLASAACIAASVAIIYAM